MRSAIGNGALCNNMAKVGNTISFGVGGADELSVSLTFAEGTTGVKVSFWISIDGVNYHSIEASCANDASTYMTSTTFPQLYSFDVSMGTSFRLKLEEITSGAICAFATSFTLN